MRDNLLKNGRTAAALFSGRLGRNRKGVFLYVDRTYCCGQYRNFSA